MIVKPSESSVVEIMKKSLKMERVVNLYENYFPAREQNGFLSHIHLSDV